MDIKKFESELEQECQTWISFLNNTFAIIIFTTGLACLGTDYPATFAVISIIFLCLLRIEANKLFPKKITILRKLAQHDKRAKNLLNKYERQYFSLRNMLRSSYAFTFSYFLGLS